MKLLKVLLLLLFFTNISMASHLTVSILTDGNSENLKNQIISESNRLFNHEEHINFVNYEVKDRDIFDEIYKKQLDDTKIDVVIALGLKNSTYLISQVNHSKPSIAIGFTNWQIQKAKKKKNLTIIDFSSYRKDINFIRENFPSDKIAIVTSDFIKSNNQNVINISNKSKLKQFDFVYVTSLNAEDEKKKEELFNYLNNNKIKSFYGNDSSNLKNKPLFSNIKNQETKISRSIALLLYQVLINKESLESHIKLYPVTQVALNSNSANKVYYSPTFDLLSKVVKKENILESSRSLDLNESLNLVLKNSYDYKIAKNSLDLINQDIKNAESSYKPNIYADVSYTIIDSDRALYSNGTSSQKTFAAGITLSQLIFSNSSSKSINIQKSLYDSKQNESQVTKERILYKVIITYLNTLNIKKSYEIVNSKANFIKQNLNLANNRLEVGLSDKSDIYRWQNELANVNIDLVNVKREFNSLKIELSNLLQIPNKQNISLKEYSINDDLFKLFGQTPAQLIARPSELEKLSDFLTNSVILKHNTLKTYEELITAKKQELLMNKQNKYMPTISLSANVNQTLNRSGKGADFNRAWDDNQYQVGLNLTMPIYESGKKNVLIEKNRIELINLQHKLQNEKSKLQKETFQTLQNISSSFNSIRFSTLAYESANKNYELIQDKYSKGKASIVTLLDAQNSMIISNINKHSSVYNYLRDISTIFYNIGYIEVINDRNKKDEMQIKLKEVLK